jgi:hypothetical protein
MENYIHAATIPVGIEHHGDKVALVGCLVKSIS